MKLLVVIVLLSSFISIRLGFRMCWAWLIQVGRVLAPIVVAQFLDGPLKREKHTCRSFVEARNAESV